MYKLLLSCLVVFNINAGAQSGVLLPDQNPNYLKSQEKYMIIKDSLLLKSNTTQQKTYKAFDWYQNKLDKKTKRKLNRQNNSWNNSAWGYSPSLSSFGYHNNFGYNDFRYGANSYWRRPYIGFRTGNWFFGF